MKYLYTVIIKFYDEKNVSYIYWTVDIPVYSMRVDNIQKAEPLESELTNDKTNKEIAIPKKLSIWWRI